MLISKYESLVSIGRSINRHSISFSIKSHDAEIIRNFVILTNQQAQTIILQAEYKAAVITN